MDSFKSDIIVPSVTHGAAAAEGWLALIEDVMTSFVRDPNVDRAIAELVRAAEAYAPKK
jgi:hypothetical protein